MYWKGKKVLVTGADGFIGSHLTEKLYHLGCQVRAFVQYNSFNSWGWIDTLPLEVKNNIEVVTGDIRDFTRVTSAIDGCSLVMHLAAIIAIPYSYSAPQTYVDINVKGTLNLLEAAKNANIEKFIHTSTSEVYGTAQFVPITEEHPLSAQSPYAASKIAADQMALSFFQSFSLPVAIARPFNTYGPRQSMRAIIPTVIAQIANNQRNIKLGSLHPTRDFNYIDDTVEGFIALANTEGILGETFNFGSNYEISVGETVKLIAELMGKDINIISDDERIRPEHSEVNRLWAENAKARKRLDWQPQYAHREGFIKGLQKTIAWFSDPDNLKLYKPELYNV